MSDLSPATVERMNAVQARLKDAKVNGMSFTRDPESWNAMSKDERANVLCDVLEAILDGRCRPALKFNDSKRLPLEADATPPPSQPRTGA